MARASGACSRRAFATRRQPSRTYLTQTQPLFKPLHISSQLKPPHSPPKAKLTMSAEEDQQSQSGYDESAGGPGAPTPLGALEVRHVTKSFDWNPLTLLYCRASLDSPSVTSSCS
jgi:hypothetical protein